MKAIFTAFFTTFLSTILLCVALPNAFAQDCVAPENVNLSNKEARQVTMRWNPLPKANSFLVRYKADSEAEFKTMTLGQGVNFTGITGLIPSTNYTACVLALCLSGDSTIESAERCIQFTTCPENANPPLIFGVKNNEVFCLNDTTKYMLSASVGGGDFTGNGIINNYFTPSLATPGENIIYYSISSEGCVSLSTIKVIVSAPIASSISGMVNGARLCSNNSNPVRLIGAPAGGGFYINNVLVANTIIPTSLPVGNHILTYKPLETICSSATTINFSVLASNNIECIGFGPCDVPANVRAQLSNSRTSAAVVWSQVSGANTYQVSYRDANTMGAWLIRTVRANNAALQNLSANTRYEVRVRTVCNKTKTSDWSLSTIIETPSGGCQTPIFTNVTNITKSTATLNWNASKEVKKYYILVSQAGRSEVVYTSTTANFTLRGLMPGTNYNYRIRTGCTDGSVTIPAPVQSFMTTK